MPRRRPTTTARRGPDIRSPEEAWRWVTDSWPADPVAEGLNPFFQFVRPGEEAGYWREFGPRVLRLWPAQRPGTRPRLWWAFEAPEDRKQVGGTGHPEGGEKRFGVSRRWRDVNPEDPPTVESQAAFLQRLDLLAPGEADRIPDAAFAPEVLRIQRGWAVDLDPHNRAAA